VAVLSNRGWTRRRRRGGRLIREGR
jgi:hypothetical protein